MSLTVIFTIAWGLLLCLFSGVAEGATCSYKTGHDKRYIYCEYGCCGNDDDQKCCSYEISTSVLVVACVVSGLVLLALLVAFVICCYKNYKDKQASRVRAIRQEQARNAPIRPAAPPKAPTYIEAPPEYSAEMPESHFRPPTASGRYNTPHNQRYGRTQNNVTQRSSTSQQAGTDGRVILQVAGLPSQQTQLNHTSTQIPGSTDMEAPPAYTEFARGQTPANNRHRRFIRTPAPEYSETENSSDISRPAADLDASARAAGTVRASSRSQVAPSPHGQVTRRAGAPNQPTILETEPTDIEELSAI